ncbi:MAG: EAL domain-containing protein [Deltaproteobacteria bacterium]|nr:EAL domain-containing protein [Deltaproteobacteria bacterium]
MTDAHQPIIQTEPIIIIEDDVFFAELMASALTDEGHACLSFACGHEAFAWLASNNAALIIIDYTLPDMTGSDFIERMRELGMATPFVMVTGRDDSSLAVQMMKTGACDFMIKDTSFLARLPSVISRAMHEVETRRRLERAEMSLRLSESRLVRAQRIARMGSWEWNITNGEIYWSDELYRIFGRSPGDPVNISMEWIYTLVSPPDLAAFKKAVLTSVKTGEPFNIVYRITTLDLGEVVVNSQGEVECDESGRPRLISGTTLDVTARIKAESEIQHLINYDTLTGLPNRSLLSDRFHLAIAQSARDKSMLGVLVLDLDRFKAVNDTMGHVIGDKLLKIVAKRLMACVRESDTLARLGGDEFVAILVGVTQEEGITSVAKKVLAIVSEPVYIDGHEIYSTCSIGIAVYPEDGADGSTLLKHADTAMYQAKDLERNNFQFFSREMNIKLLERMMLENSMRKALEREEFFLVYQPQVDARTGRITGMEALLRWKHPEMGLLAPDRFIYLAEENSFILSLGEWVLRTACQQNKAWQDEGLPAVRIAVNISARQFSQYHLDEVVASTLLETGLEPEWLELEITESTIMKDAERNTAILQKFKDMGISIAIDDFGTGYSSLSYLKLFPVSRLKIDRSFVGDVTTDPDAAAIANIIIDIARSLKLSVIAEGVETRAQMQFLSFNNCIEMQGYLFSRPVRAEQFAELLRNGLKY